MSLYVLDAFIWILGIRGHIPQSGELGRVASQSSVGASAGTVMHALAAFIVMIAFLSLMLWLWLAVWLAIKLL